MKLLCHFMKLWHLWIFILEDSETNLSHMRQVLIFKIERLGIEKMAQGLRAILLYQRNWDQFPSPTSGGSQMLCSHQLEDPRPSLVLSQCVHNYIKTQTWLKKFFLTSGSLGNDLPIIASWITSLGSGDLNANPCKDKCVLGEK